MGLHSKRSLSELSQMFVMADNNLPGVKLEAQPRVVEAMRNIFNEVNYRAYHGRNKAKARLSANLMLSVILEHEAKQIHLVQG